MLTHQADILLLGTGRLSQELVMALASLPICANEQSLRVVIAGRDLTKANWLKTLACARLRLSRANTIFSTMKLDWKDNKQISEQLDFLNPRIVVHMASYQSAWELSDDNAWSELVKRAGYGVTAALQGALLYELNTAIEHSRVHPIVINGCYPDVINAATVGMSCEPLCGFGNVALLAENFRQHLSSDNSDSVKVIAHHWDVTQFIRPIDDRSPDLPYLWLNGKRINTNNTTIMPSLSGCSSINSLNASLTAPLVVSIARRRKYFCHAAGPCGMLGGYPIKYDEGTMTLDIPSDVEPKELIQYNEKRSSLDGAVAFDNQICFSESAIELLTALDPNLQDKFKFIDIRNISGEFLQLRKYLRSKQSISKCMAN